MKKMVLAFVLVLGLVSWGCSESDDAPDLTGEPCPASGYSGCGQAGDSCAECGQSFYCSYEYAPYCGADPMGSGSCQPKPTSCSPSSAPVCDCDGNEYSSECEARERGYGGPVVACASAPSPLPASISFAPSSPRFGSIRGGELESISVTEEKRL